MMEYDCGYCPKHQSWNTYEEGHGSKYCEFCGTKLIYDSKEMESVMLVQCDKESDRYMYYTDLWRKGLVQFG
jgi:hypothetical protein